MSERPRSVHSNAPPEEMGETKKGVEAVGQASLATEFSKQTSPLSASQIDSLKNFNKDGLKIVLAKIAKDAREKDANKSAACALNTIAPNLASFTKDELQAIFQVCPKILNNIVLAVNEGHADALKIIGPGLAGFTKETLQEIFQRCPQVLNNIAYVARKDHPKALDAISVKLASFTKDELQAIFQVCPGALSNIASAACYGHAKALTAISYILVDFTGEELLEIYQKSTSALSNIALAAWGGYPEALDAIFSSPSQYGTVQLQAILQSCPSALGNIALAASRGHARALNAIGSRLAGFTKETLQEILKECPCALGNIALAAREGYPEALNAIGAKIEDFTSEELQAILNAYPNTLSKIASAASQHHPEALKAIAPKLVCFPRKQLQTILQKALHALNNIAVAACHGYPEALNAVAPEIATFSQENLQAILKASPTTLQGIMGATYEGHPNALKAIFSCFLNDMTDLSGQQVPPYSSDLNHVIGIYLSSAINNKFLGLERAFCDLSRTMFSLLTTGVAPEIIFRLKRSINWYKKFTDIMNGSQSDQSGMSRAEASVQESISSSLCGYINKEVLQQDLDKTSRDSRISFVDNLCAYLAGPDHWDLDETSRDSSIYFIGSLCGYLAGPDHYRIVANIKSICKTYQSGTDGHDISGYEDSDLKLFSTSTLSPDGLSLFAAGQELDSGCEKIYQACVRLKHFDKNLGLWIQAEPGRSPLLAQEVVVEAFKKVLQSHQDKLGQVNMRDTGDPNLDYEAVKEVLYQNDRELFKCQLKNLIGGGADKNKEYSEPFDTYEL